MEIKQFRKLNEEKSNLDDIEVTYDSEFEDDVYAEEAREQEVEDDELKGWEDGWMKGYNDAKKAR